MQYTVHCTLILYTVHFKQYTVKCALYTVHSTVYTVHCKLYTVHCTLHSTQLGGAVSFIAPLAHPLAVRDRLCNLLHNNIVAESTCTTSVLHNTSIDWLPCSTMAPSAPQCIGQSPPHLLPWQFRPTPPPHALRMSLALSSYQPSPSPYTPSIHLQPLIMSTYSSFHTANPMYSSNQERAGHWLMQYQDIRTDLKGKLLNSWNKTTVIPGRRNKKRSLKRSHGEKETILLLLLLLLLPSPSFPPPLLPAALLDRVTATALPGLLFWTLDCNRHHSCVANPAFYVWVKYTNMTYLQNSWIHSLIYSITLWGVHRTCVDTRLDKNDF